MYCTCTVRTILSNPSGGGCESVASFMAGLVRLLHECTAQVILGLQHKVHHGCVGDVICMYCTDDKLLRRTRQKAPQEEGMNQWSVS